MAVVLLVVSVSRFMADGESEVLAVMGEITTRIKSHAAMADFEEPHATVACFSISRMTAVR